MWREPLRPASRADDDQAERSQRSPGKSAELEAYDEVVRRFGKSETPALLERVATALVKRGAVLGALNRPQDALEACDEVVRRFGKSETPALLERVATALVNRGTALGALNRPQDALEACDEVVRRFGESETPALLEGELRPPS